MRNTKISWQNILVIIISITALVLSYLAWDMSRQSYNFDSKNDTAKNIRDIREFTDSTKIYFSLGNKFEIKNLIVVFPKAVTNKKITSASKPMEINKKTIELFVKKYLEKKISKEDAIEIQGTFELPVMVDYLVMIYGQKYSLRENRLLMFHYHYQNNITKVNYVDTYTSIRCLKPLRRHYFVTLPFNELTNKKIEKQDNIDVQKYLEQQLKVTSNL